MIGVNVNGYDVKKLKEAMDKEKLTWRSFADPGRLGHGAIATKWNFAATPTLYIIDHKGVIRHKWVGNSSGNEWGGCPARRSSMRRLKS